MRLDHGVARQPNGLDARFRRALESILDLVVVERVVRDAHGEIVDFEIVWMNNAPVDVADRPREVLIGRRISELYPALAGGQLIADYRRVVETGEPLVIPVMAYEDVIDGRQVSGFYTVQATKFEDGVLVASRDITPLESSRRELEVALRELEGAQRLARLGTWRIDLVAGQAELSRELQRILGLAPDASPVITLVELAALIHPADLAAANGAHRRAIATRTGIVIDHRVIRGDGAIAHMRTYAEPLIVDDEVAALWGTMQDISDAIASRDALDAEHSRRVSAEALAELGSTLNGARTLQDVADAVLHATTRFGPPAAVVLAVTEAEEPTLRHHFGGGAVPGDIQARYRRTPLAVDTHMTRVVNDGRPLFLDSHQAQSGEFPALARELAAMSLDSVAVLPLRRASGTVFGAVAFAWSDAHDYDAETRVLLAEMATVVGRTAERLELLDLERSVARTLQLGLLALDVRSTHAIVRARYRAADATLEIGGDWYDAVELGDGRIAVAVGDVVGRGLAAATTMGQLRAALGVTALQAADAADAIGILDSYAKHVPGAYCATVAFAIVDPIDHLVTYASAGHVPPLLVTPDGTATYLSGGRSWPLSVDAAVRRAPAASALLPPGSLLLLFTDGLVERRREAMDVGLERLRALVAENWNLPLRRLKQAIFSALVDDADEAAGDDIALVAVRTTGAGDALFVDVFHARPEEATAARHRQRAWLEDRDVESDQRDALLLAIGEAVANAIDHGSRRDDTQIVRVEIARRGNEIIASVGDSGQWLPGVGGYFSGRGRGHLLMEALCDDVDVDTDQHGTIVTLRMALREREPA